MNKQETFNLNLENEFKRIFKKFEKQVDNRILDLHSIQLALTNLPERKVVKMPSVFISYFLKQMPDEPQNIFVSNTKKNYKTILARTNNYFAQNILHLAEEHLIEGLVLLKTIQSQTSLTISTLSFKKLFNSEISKVRMFGNLEEEIKKLVKKSGKEIIPKDCPYYSYLKNYVTLRNCFTHRSGKITKKEEVLEIRLPNIDIEQIEIAKQGKTDGKLNPSTIIRKWNFNENIELTIHEVEGIAYGLLRTVFEIIKHLYKAADKHVEKLENMT